MGVSLRDQQCGVTAHGLWLQRSPVHLLLQGFAYDFERAAIVISDAKDHYRRNLQIQGYFALWYLQKSVAEDVCVGLRSVARWFQVPHRLGNYQYVGTQQIEDLRTISLDETLLKAKASQRIDDKVSMSARTFHLPNKMRQIALERSAYLLGPDDSTFSGEPTIRARCCGERAPERRMRLHREHYRSRWRHKSVIPRNVHWIRRGGAPDFPCQLKQTVPVR